ncbi:MAG: SpoIID/LytB domain-containing protein [Spirochaetes bacterium]|nr:SpoIID/LytB domain-containing protein [Spirochaetota bacterium]
MMLKKIILSFVLILSVVYYGCTPPKNYISDSSRRKISSVRTVKVLILKTGQRTVFSSAKNISVYDGGNSEIFNGKSFSVSAADVKSKIRISSADEIIRINDTPYRGNVVIQKENDSMLVINHVNIEKYLCSVVPSEMAKSWPIEALKAQAIAARTYAYNHIASAKNTVYDLDATTSFQVYKGCSVEGPVSNEAVFLTAGVIMVSGGKPIAAFFHSTCGGETISNQFVWQGEKISYLNDEKCSYCSDSPYFTWTEEVNLNEFRSALLKKNPSAGSLKGITFKKHNGRIIECIIKHTGGVTSLTGNDLRLFLGAKKIKSLYFTTSKINNVIRISGHGYGHGVGMCQYGARGMAMKGLDHVEILRKYYRGIEFLRI